MGNHSDEERKRRNAARIALFAYALCVLTALAGLWKAANGDTNSAVSLALSALLFLVSAIGFTARSRGY
jgi:hypothetical protein